MTEQIFVVVGSLVLLMVALGIGIPVSFSIGLVGIFFLTLLKGLGGTVTLIGLYAQSAIFDYMLVALPLFIFMADILARGGTADGLFDAARKWSSRLPGGLAVAAVWASVLFGSICGSGSATAAVMGRLAIPSMLDNKYSKQLAFGTVTSSASLGIIIPPSLPLIIYGTVADESIGKLFIAGIFPGVLLAVVLSIYIVIACKRKGDLAPSVAGFPWRDRISSLVQVWPAVVLFVVVLGSIYAGVATITESAAAGAVGALIVTAIFRKLNWQVIRDSILGAMRLTSFIFAILIAGKLFAHVMTEAGLSDTVASFAQGLASPWLLLAMLTILWLFLGCFLDMASIMVLTIPVLLPAINVMGWDKVWLGIVLLFNVAVGTITPPVGVHFFVTKGVGDSIAHKYGSTSLELIIRSCFPYIWLTALVMVIVMVFPPLSTWLPGQMMKPPTFK